MGYIFGPVLSNRLGKSLGVDLIPHKLCNFDCIYCECGKTKPKINRRLRFVNRRALREEFNRFLFLNPDISFDAVTITGSGEPTLEIQLADIILDLKELTAQPIAVLTNSSWMHDEKVRKALANADIILPSLDAARQSTFCTVDQPDINIRVEEIIKGLIQFRKDFPNVRFWLEVLIVKGLNDSLEDIHTLKKAIHAIGPDRVDVSTVSRPPAYIEAMPVGEAKLNQIRKELFYSAGNIKSFFPDKNIRGVNKICRMPADMICETVRRRPFSIRDLSRMTGLPENTVREKLKPFVEEGKMCVRNFRGELLYARS